MPRVAPRWCGPRLSRRRALRTRLTVLGGSACGHRLGAEVRSSRPAGPCSRYRRTHLWAVALDTPAASAAETTDHHISCTRCTISRRPNGVSFALRWGTESLLSREGPCQPFTVTGGSPVSTTFVGTTARSSATCSTPAHGGRNDCSGSSEMRRRRGYWTAPESHSRSAFRASLCPRAAGPAASEE